MPKPSNVERERRFLVDEPSFLEGASWSWIAQAYVYAERGYAIRVRVERSSDSKDDGLSTLSAKGPRIGPDRVEYNIDIDARMAQSIIENASLVITKKRYFFTSAGQAWDVDVFEGPNEGLVIAELEGEDLEDVKAPWWAVREITGETRFNNDELVKRPVSEWPDDGWKSQSIWD